MSTKPVWTNDADATGAKSEATHKTGKKEKKVPKRTESDSEDEMSDKGKVVKHSIISSIL